MKRRPRIWLRRIISTTLLLAVIAGIGYLLYLFGMWVWGSLHESRAASAEATTPRPTVIESCTADDLTASLVPNSRNLYVSEGMTVQFKLEVQKGKECSLDPAEINVSLTSDDYPIWTPTKCAPSTDVLLLAEGASYSRELVWDARIYENCEQVADLFAEVGTYELSTKIGAATVGTPIKIVVS